MAAIRASTEKGRWARSRQTATACVTGRSARARATAAASARSDREPPLSPADGSSGAPDLRAMGECVGPIAPRAVGADIAQPNGSSSTTSCRRRPSGVEGGHEVHRCHGGLEKCGMPPRLSHERIVAKNRCPGGGPAAGHTAVVHGSNIRTPGTFHSRNAHRCRWNGWRHESRARNRPGYCESRQD
jgi:hypothetical protein